MNSWLMTLGFWFIAPQLVAWTLGTVVRAAMRRNPNTVLPETAAALAGPATLLGMHALFAPAVDAATSAIGYDDAWSVRFVVPAIIAHFICGAALTMVSSRTISTKRDSSLHSSE